jgi:hypothetical protein
MECQMAQTNDFSWSDPRSVVVKRVDAIAVYKNRDGDIVNRQENPAGETDRIVVVPAQYAYTVLEAMQQQLKAQMFSTARPADLP